MSSKNNYPPKIICPNTAKIIHRERLFHALNIAREQAKIIWIAAPGGSGKTTLVSSYLKKKQVAHCWYQVDEDDRDLANFFHYMGLAGKLAAPQRKKTIAKLMPEHQQGIATFTRLFFKDISSRLKNDGIIVLDNFHILPENDPVPALLPTIIESLTSGVSLLIISRYLPPSSMITFTAKRQLFLIETKQIRFTENEWLAASQLLLSKHSEKTLLSIHQKLDGWIAGLILLPDTPKVFDNVNTTGLGIEILDAYIAEQFLTSLNTESSELLMKVCYMPYITPASAKMISHLPHSKKLLSELARKNLFVLRHGEKGYTLHPLVREYLIQRAEDTLPKASLYDLQKSTAMALLKEGEYESAADLLLELGEWKILANVILDYAASLHDCGRIESLQQYISALPQTFKQHEPWILFWKGKISAHSDVISALDFFDGAYTSFVEKKDVRGIYLTWYSSVSVICNTLMGGSHLIVWLQRYHEFSAQYPEPPRDLQKDFIDAILLQSYYCSGLDTYKIPALQARIGQAINAENDSFIRLHMISNYVHVAVLSGIRARDKVILDKFENCLGDVKDDPILYLGALTFCSLAAGAYNDFDKILDLEWRAIAVAEESGISIFNYHIYAKIIVAAHGLKKHDLARKYLNLMKEEISGKNSISQSLYFMSMIVVASQVDDDVDLRKMAKQYLDILESTNFPPFILHIKLFYLNYLSVKKCSEEAFSLHDELLQQVDRLSFPAQSSRFYMIFAKVYFDNGEVNYCDRYLKKSFNIASQNEIITYANWAPELMMWACQRALFLDIETSYIKNIIHTHYLNLPRPDLDSNYYQWPWMFRVFTFGGVELKKSSDDIHQRQLPSKSFALFKVLMKVHDGHVTNDTLREKLYADNYPEKTSQLLDTQIHRLRKFLGSEKTIIREGDRIKLNLKYFWFDIHEFEILGKQKVNRKNALSIANQLQVLYTGEYLPEDEEIEAIAHRERYRNIYLATLFRCLDHLDENPDEAVELCQNALVLEPLSEPLYRKLIYLYLQQGNRNMAEATLIQCRNLVKQHLDSDLSIETLSLLTSTESIAHI